MVTGADIHPAATVLAEEAGYTLVHTPPYPSAEVLIDFIARYEPVGAVSRMGRFGAEPMAASRSLRVISKHGAGVDNIDVEAATAHSIQVVRATGANALSVAEHAVTLAVTAIKRLIPLDRTLRGGQWEKPHFVGREMAGMRVGLVGAGAIARAAARLFRGLGFEVSAYDPYAGDDAFAAMGAARHAAFAEMLVSVDVVSLHCPLTDATHHLMNEETLRLMPKGGYVVNTARGGLIDEMALLRALDSGQLAGAGLDTFETEPLPAGSRLVAAGNLIVTPHVGGSTEEAMKRVAVDAVQAIIDIAEGRSVAADRLVNRVLPPPAQDQPHARRQAR
nr:NAD(P)-dependent oxidoreductase [Jiella avicenniae]